MQWSPIESSQCNPVAVSVFRWHKTTGIIQLDSLKFLNKLKPDRNPDRNLDHNRNPDHNRNLDLNRNLDRDRNPETKIKSHTVRMAAAPITSNNELEQLSSKYNQFL